MIESAVLAPFRIMWVVIDVAYTLLKLFWLRTNAIVKGATLLIATWLISVNYCVPCLHWAQVAYNAALIILLWAVVFLSLAGYDWLAVPRYDRLKTNAGYVALWGVCSLGTMFIIL